jgi:predicted neuraminidase
MPRSRPRGAFLLLFAVALIPFLARAETRFISMPAASESETPFLKSELLFPLEHWHNHASCIVETPEGDLLVCWFHGSGERQADDVAKYADRLAGDAGDKLKRRLGWMTRAHPFLLDGTRLIVPLYSDRFSFSLMAYTDDWGKSWSTSTPLVGAGNIQPSIVRRTDGTLVTYMRDNGPAPKRLMMSTSADRAETWTPVVDTQFPNPGSGAEVLGLKNGHWVLIYNDLERGRYQLAVSLSEDEGRTWPWTRHLERDPASADPEQLGEYHYPSIMQARDGSLHASYSYFLPIARARRDAQDRPLRKSIKHAQFNEAWIRQGDRP